MFGDSTPISDGIERAPGTCVVLGTEDLLVNFAIFPSHLNHCAVHENLRLDAPDTGREPTRARSSSHRDGAKEPPSDHHTDNGQNRRYLYLYCRRTVSVLVWSLSNTPVRSSVLDIMLTRLTSSFCVATTQRAMTQRATQQLRRQSFANMCLNDITIQGEARPLRQFRNEQLPDDDPDIPWPTCQGLDLGEDADYLEKYEWDDPQPITEEESKLHYNFYTRWSPPCKFVEAAAKKYPELNFHLEFEEYGSNFGGAVQYAGGKLIYEEDMEYMDWNWKKADKDSCLQRDGALGSLCRTRTLARA